MNDNKNPDRPPAEGQQGIDRETEQRNRENETGQQPGQQGGQSPSDKERGSSAFGQPGQSAGGDTTVSERTGQTASEGGGGFVGSKPEDSSDYLTKGEQDQDFAPEGQGAQDSEAGKSDIETGQASDRASGLDDGSDTDR